MSTDTNTNVLSDVDEDREEQQAVLDKIMNGKPIPPAIEQRIRRRAARIRAEILRQHGVQDIGVSILRELRGELPEP